MAAGPIKVVFVCWGNICRSPIAERVARQAADAAGLTGVEFTSAATSSEELGSPIDRRAQRVLAAHGYSYDAHSAHRITADELDGADLVVAMEDIHVAKLGVLSPHGANVALLSDFDPAAARGSGVPDPWYDADAGFEDTLTAIEAAMPGILAKVRELQVGVPGSVPAPAESRRV